MYSVFFPVEDNKYIDNVLHNFLTYNSPYLRINHYKIVQYMTIQYNTIHEHIDGLFNCPISQFRQSLS